MNKLGRFFTLLFITAIALGLLCPTTAFCASATLKSSDVEVAAGRLFDVDIAVKSDETLTAGSFRLEYDPNTIEIRSVSANTIGEVRSADDGGETTAIYLCSNGISLKNSPSLISVRYKLLKSADAKIKISAYDFTNMEVENFTPPQPIYVKVKAVVKTSSQGSSKARAGAKSSVGKSTKSKNGSKSSTSSGKSISHVPTGDETTAEEANTFDLDGTSSRDFFSYFLPYAGAIFFFVFGFILLTSLAISMGKKKKRLERRVEHLEAKLGEHYVEEDDEDKGPILF